MINKEWNYGTHKGAPKKLQLEGFLFVENTAQNPRMVIFLNEMVEMPDGSLEFIKTNNYEVVKGAISKDIDDNPLPKNELQPDMSLIPVYLKDEEGNDLLDEKGNKIPAPRDNAYENIKAMVDSGISPYVLIDAGVKERFKLSE